MNTKTRSVHFHLGALAAVLAALLVCAAVAKAHSVELLKSIPADGATLDQAPSQVVATFSEELLSGQSNMKLVDAAGQQVRSGDSKLDLDDPNHVTLLLPLTEPLPAGAYTVLWHVTLTDGDASDGKFGFTVGQGAIAVRAAAPAPTLRSPLGGIGLLASVAALAVVIAGGVSIILIRRRGQG